MDRLLSEQEILNACVIRAKDALWATMTADEKFRASSTAVAAAQLAKTDKEWVEWAETTLRACTTRTCKYHDKNCLYLRDILCGAWQSRRKEIGL